MQPFQLQLISKNAMDDFEDFIQVDVAADVIRVLFDVRHDPTVEPAQGISEDLLCLLLGHEARPFAVSHRPLRTGCIQPVPKAARPFSIRRPKRERKGNGVAEDADPAPPPPDVAAL